MAWTNYRNIVGRFGHIDAEVVKSAGLLSPGGGTAELVVRFYPWWEHPRYVSAVQRGDDWGFSSCEAGKREVTVRAVQPWAFRLSRQRYVVDWAFEEDHPLLWAFAEQSSLFVNAPFDPETFFDGLMESVPNASDRDLRYYVQFPDPRKAPLGLTVPAQLHAPVLSVFRRLGVPVFSPGSPRAPERAIVFLIGNDDYIIAQDFEVDVPEFVPA